MEAATIREDRTHEPMPGPLAVPKKPHVLVVEDDADMRRLIAAVLRQDGYAVVEASGGVDLLDWVELTTGTHRGFFEAIVSDINMPDLSALEALEALRARPWKTPVILITAFGDSATRERADGLGVAMVLDKPLDLDALRAALSAVARRRPKRPEGGWFHA